MRSKIKTGAVIVGFLVSGFLIGMIAAWLFGDILDAPEVSGAAALLYLL